MKAWRGLMISVVATVTVAMVPSFPSGEPVSAQDQSRIRWRFRIAADYALHRPAIGADGTIYVNDVKGHLYAINPDGTEKWLFQAGLGGGAHGPVAVGQDGTIYVPALVPSPSGSGNTGGLYAVNPNGTLRWLFNATGGGLIVAGPNVGPDGNVYAVAEWPGIGLFSLTPSGQLRFARDAFLEYGPLGEEVVFGAPGQLYFTFDMVGMGDSALFGYTLDGNRVFQVPAYGGGGQRQPAVGPNGAVYVHTFSGGLGLGAYSASGSLLWNFYEFPGNTQTHPDVGPDDVIYMGRNLSTLLALTPQGSVKWRYQDSGILFDPIVSPVNTLIFMGGRITYGEPGFFAAVSTAGALLWKIDLPVEPGFEPYGQIIPVSRARFTQDGATAYIATDVAGDGNSANPYSFLYAINTASTSATDCVGKGTAVILGTVKTAAGAAVSGVTISLAGASGCASTTTTDSRGRFRFPSLATGTYTVTPGKTGCTFSPASQTVTLSGNRGAAAFTASCP